MNDLSSSSSELPYPEWFAIDVYKAFIERYTRATKFVLDTYPQLRQKTIIGWIQWNDPSWHRFKKTIKWIEKRWDVNIRRKDFTPDKYSGVIEQWLGEKDREYAQRALTAEIQHRKM